MKDVPWHAIPVEETVQKLQTSVKTGLDPAEVDKRQATVGANVLTPPPTVPAWRRFLAQFENPLIIILLVSAGACVLVGRITDALTILAVTIVNAVIGFVQEQNAQKAIDALAKMVKTECHVFRGSDIPVKIDAEGLVPGDLILLTSGDRVPADLRIIDSKNLQINESALTGESLPVSKSTSPVPEDAGLGDRKCLAFSGALVTGGTGLGLVVATGDATQIGLINAMMNQTEEIDTPLMRRLEAFSSVFGYWVIGFSVTLMAIGIYHALRSTVPPFLCEGPEQASLLQAFVLVKASVIAQLGGCPVSVPLYHSLSFVADVGDASFRLKIVEVFMAAVSAAVGAIPEGLPAVMTIVLAIGTKNMAARKAIIRKLPAVETLGSVTVICSDKTGTLTANEMTVQRILAGGKGFTVDGVGFNP
ncbi:MAG TPA: HAD-IC family P-type ATPase, partial [Candidatus Ozemobacteraceae bacterium]|nr:HAD-IC family P-type ATPase [Candidatus Ozemobacteraceae bacterium]